LIVGLASIALFSRAFAVFRLSAVIALAVYWHYAFELRSLNGQISPQFIWYLTFALGVLAFAFFRRARVRLLICVAVAGLATMAYLVIVHGPAVLFADIDRSPPLILSQLCFGVFCAAAAILIERFSVLAGLSKLGKFSYTLFVVHFPIMLFLYFVFVNSGGRYSLPLGWTIALASASGCIYAAHRLSTVLENAPLQKAFLRGVRSRITNTYLGLAGRMGSSGSGPKDGGQSS
jgi:peptidoglycan/LPS O-acetylase OafA/YrhL